MYDPATFPFDHNFECVYCDEQGEHAFDCEFAVAMEKCPRILRLARMGETNVIGVELDRRPTPSEVQRLFRLLKPKFEDARLCFLKPRAPR